MATNLDIVTLLGGWPRLAIVLFRRFECSEWPGTVAFVHTPATTENTTHVETGLVVYRVRCSRVTLRKHITFEVVGWKSISGHTVHT